MSDAIDDVIDREEDYELLLWDHRNDLCNPNDCPFCNGTYKDRLFK